MRVSWPLNFFLWEGRFLVPGLGVGALGLGGVARSRLTFFCARFEAVAAEVL